MIEQAQEAVGFGVKEYTAIVGAIVSVAGAVFSWIGAKKSLGVQYGNQELSLIKEIDEAYGKVDEVGLKMLELTKEDGGMPHATVLKLQQLYQGRVQAWLNKFETACGMYKDGKVDKVRFRKNFATRLRQLCETPGYPLELLNLGPTTHYEAIQAVYQEFHKHGG